MNAIQRLFVVVAFWGATCSPALAVVDLVLRSVAEVPHRQVYLRDIVESPTVVPDALARVVIASLTRADQVVSISAGQVRRLIDRQAPGAAPQIRLTGAEAVAVTLPGAPLPERDIEAAARNLMTRALSAMSEVWVIDGLSIRARAQSIPRGTLDVQAAFDRPLRRGYPVQVAVSVYVDGHLIERVPVSIAMHTKAPVVRSARALQRGEALAASDLENAGAVQIAWDEFPPLRVDDTGPARRTRRAVAQGAILRADDVEAAPAVGKAQEVVAERRTQSIVIEKRMLAEADAFLGAPVKVTDPGSGLSFFAKVIAPGRVEVQ